MGFPSKREDGPARGTRSSAGFLVDDLIIHDLRTVPHFTATVADRLWHAWWREEGVALDALQARVRESLGTEPVPTTLVAQSGATFLGTISLIACDMEERPALTPWLAALWVEPAHRRAGLGTALVEAAARLACREGYPRIYLAATAAHAGFYRRRGWATHETGIGGLDILSRCFRPG
ncbi:GNAT family N-acetyltransferase [Ancylobacter oerskovii]|uniref:GNAT family N-acetyltransferase n=1 Tax=Ancylobacter oerskovii TaxID=459519 RepID=A0ABW4YUP4_9HYPH|nr:GNAT family N-acetyltransferase [Ancylobacter oerskovii]MBS7544526.1 GNAT family N-acetyltransferase [Ancylobacter oerskovii]